MSVENDAQLRIRAVVPDFDVFVGEYRRRSEATRREVTSYIDVSYGESAAERLDVFLPSRARAGRPIVVFFHGGYWRAFDKADYSYVADPVVARGGIAIVPNYALMPRVSMSELIAQCQRAIHWVYDHALVWGGDPTRIVVSGHSAGAHIAAFLALTDRVRSDRPESSLIKSVVCVSGLYDLQPVFDSFLQLETGLSTNDVRDFSPLRVLSHGQRTTSRFQIIVGEQETLEFKKQARKFARALEHHGAKLACWSAPNRHHMQTVLDLGDAQSALGARLLSVAFDDSAQ